jgi:Ca-activated chloride channel family protein
MNHYVFKDPIWFAALAALPVILWLRSRRRVPVLLVPFAAAWHRPSLAAPSRWPVGLAVAGIVLLVAALARPQRVEDKREVHSQGYDIMLAVDLSGSMLAEDYVRDGERINRLQAIKPVIQAFIDKRPADRIGVVLFSGRAYTMAPLTFDHDWLAKQLERVRIGLIEDGTAIGDGLGVSLTRLEQAKRESGGKRQGAFIVLLTDGANNRGALTPAQATELAKSRGIPVYTIGAGQDGLVPFPVFDDKGRKHRLPARCGRSRRKLVARHRDHDRREVLPGVRHRHRRGGVQGDRQGPEDRIPVEELPPDQRTVLVAGGAGAGNHGLGRAPRAAGLAEGGFRMSFAWPNLLWLLLVPIALAAWELARRRRTASAAHPKILRAEAGSRALELKGSDDQPVARAKPRWWLVIGLGLAIVALARPQWGRLEEPVFDQSREILLAIDLSRSMLTPDVAPSRLERAKLLIQSLLEKLRGERVGLAVFSGTAFLQSPLSADYEILREFLPALGPEFLPEGGTNYRALIDTAIAAFGASGSADRFLIILSDGEATEENWQERMPELKQKGIRVIGLGIGTAGGGMIPDGSGGFVKDDRGAVVLSKLENSTLQQLAQATGGVYRDSSSWLDLAALIKETVDAGQKGKFVEKNTVRLVERFQWPLALGLWCLLVSFYHEFPVRLRSRDVRLKGKGLPAKPAAAAALLLVAWSPPTPAKAAESPPPPPPAAPLAKIVGRLAVSSARTARDWSELGHETVIWGSRIQSENQPVPEGPVRDALAAADAGEKLDPQATDWKNSGKTSRNCCNGPRSKSRTNRSRRSRKIKTSKTNPSRISLRNRTKSSRTSKTSSKKRISRTKSNHRRTSRRSRASRPSATCTSRTRPRRLPRRVAAPRKSAARPKSRTSPTSPIPPSRCPCRSSTSSGTRIPPRNFSSSWRATRKPLRKNPAKTGKHPCVPFASPSSLSFRSCPPLAPRMSTGKPPTIPARSRSCSRTAPPTAIRSCRLSRTCSSATPAPRKAPRPRSAAAGITQPTPSASPTGCAAAAPARSPSRRSK